MPMLPIHQASYDRLSLEEVLEARDRRQQMQQRWLMRYQLPLISFTVLSPGAVKDSNLTRRIFNAGLMALNDLVAAKEWTVIARHTSAMACGPHDLLVVDANADELKRAMIFLENSLPQGRLWDIDVIDLDGRPLSREEHGAPARTCLLCDRPAAECAREQAHGTAQLLAKMEMLIDGIRCS